jgi:hypothetical protein
MVKEKGGKKGKGKKKWKKNQEEQVKDSGVLSAQEKRDLKFRAKAMMQATG